MFRLCRMENIKVHTVIGVKKETKRMGKKDLFYRQSPPKVLEQQVRSSLLYTEDIMFEIKKK